MKLRLQRRYLIDDFIWGTVLFQIMLGNLLGITSIISIVILSLIFISCIQNIKYFIRQSVISLILFFSVILLYPFYSFMRNGGDIYILLNNIFNILTPLAMLLYISMCCNTKGNYLSEKLLESLPLLNGYAIVNIFVMLAQLVINRRIYSNDIVYKDSISGLFGRYGTPIISIFVSFIVIYDFVLLKRENNKSLRRQLVFIFIANIILAALNDNKAFYLILPVFIAFLWFISNYERAAKRKTLQDMVKLIIKIGLLFLAGILLLILLIRYTFVGDFYNRIIHEITIGWEKTNLVQGSNERFGMISFALMNTAIRYFGYGLGRYIWKQEYAFGFIHFGQNDIGVFLILGGLVFIVLLILYILSVFRQTFKRTLTAILATVVMIVLGIYTQIFTSPSMMGCVILFMLTCWFVLSLKRDKNMTKVRMH